MQGRLLIVDDDTEIRELLEFDLAQSGYAVDSASNGLAIAESALTYPLAIAQ